MLGINQIGVGMRELQQRIIRERSCTGVNGQEHGNTLGGYSMNQGPHFQFSLIQQMCDGTVCFTIASIYHGVATRTSGAPSLPPTMAIIYI